MSELDAYLPAGLGSASLLAGLVGALTFMCVMVAWRALLERSPQSVRLRAIARRRQEIQAESAGRARRSGRRLRDTGLLRKGLRRLQLLKTVQADKIRDRLAQAGFRSREALGAYTGIKLVCPPLFAFIALLMVYLVDHRQYSTRVSPSRVGRRSIAGLLRAGYLSIQSLQQTSSRLAEGPAGRPRSAGDLCRSRVEPGHRAEPRRRRDRHVLARDGRRAWHHQRRAEFLARAAHGAGEFVKTRQNPSDARRDQHTDSNRKIWHTAITSAEGPFS